MNRLFIPLMRMPFIAFENGTKTWEVRRNEGQWAKAEAGQQALLRLGYSGSREMMRTVRQVMRWTSPMGLVSGLGWQSIIPWAASDVEAAQTINALLLGGRHAGATLVAIEMPS